MHLGGFPEANDALADDDLVASMEAARTVVELGRAARANANLKTRQPLRAVIVATEDAAKRTRIEPLASLIRDELNVKEVRTTTSAEDFASVEAVLNFRVCGPKYGKDAGTIQALLKQGKFERTGDTLKAGRWTLEPGEFEVRTRAREGFAVADGDGFAVALDTELTPELILEGRARDVIRQVQDMRKDAGLELTDRIRIAFAPTDADVFATHGDWIASETLAVATAQGDATSIAKA